jgi:hypothetical protein
MLIVLYSKISERESSLSGYELREMFETVKWAIYCQRKFQNVCMNERNIQKKIISLWKILM